MTALADHIDNAVKTGRVSTRAEVARALKVSEAAVSRWCSGHRTPSAEEARALAHVIGMPEEVLMAECEAERAKDKETRAAWLRAARFLRQATSTTALTGLLIVAFFSSLPGKAQANQVLAAPLADNLQIIAFARRALRRLLAAIQKGRRPFACWGEAATT